MCAARLSLAGKTDSELLGKKQRASRTPAAAVAATVIKSQLQRPKAVAASIEASTICEQLQQLMGQVTLKTRDYKTDTVKRKLIHRANMMMVK